MGKRLRNHRRNTSPFNIIEKKDNMKVTIMDEKVSYHCLKCPFNCYHKKK